MPDYEVVPHPADVGIEVRASSRERLFADAVLAFYDLIVGLDRIRPNEAFDIEEQGVDDEDLMVGVLNRCLFLTETRGILLREVSAARLEGGSLTLAARGERADAERHPFAFAVKAVTYHELFVGPAENGWKARIIFDI